MHLLRRAIMVPLLLTLCTLLTSYFIRLSTELLRVKYDSPLDNEAIKYVAERTAQLTIAGAGEEFTRHLLSRFGVSVDLHVIVIAAVPFDYLLTQLIPAWDAIGFDLCNPKRTIPGTFGGCAHLQAHACYQYSARPGTGSWDVWQTDASGSVDFQNMALCHAQHKISVREARQHCWRCHQRDPMFHALTVWACTANVMRSVAYQRQSCDLASAAVRCADRFGLRKETLMSMHASTFFDVILEPCADGNEETCFGMKPKIMSSNLYD